MSSRRSGESEARVDPISPKPTCRFFELWRKNATLGAKRPNIYLMLCELCGVADIPLLQHIRSDFRVKLQCESEIL
jgi:hypothetical protein